MADIAKSGPEIYERIALVEYLKTFHNIFIHRFMDKRVRIVPDASATYATKNAIRVSVESEIENMKNELRYLDEWQQEIIDNKRPAEEFLDKRTYKNIRTGVCGFLYYSKAIRSLPDGEAPDSVHYLDSNESGLENLYSQLRMENLYSQLRMANRDTVDGIDKGMLSASLNDQERKLSAGNKRSVRVFSTAYGSNHQADEVGGLTLSGKEIDRRDREEVML